MMPYPPITTMVWKSLLPHERKKLFGIWVVIMVQMVVETFSLGLIIPVVGLLTRDSYADSIPFVAQYFRGLTQSQVLIISMASMSVIYVAKSFFIFWATKLQQNFSTSVAVRIAQTTFLKYLRQPYEFHLERNSATLIANVDNARSIVSGGLDPILLLLTDGIVSLGLFALLVYVEPVGTIFVITLFGFFGLLIRSITKGPISRWGELRKFHSREVFRHMQQGLGAVKEIKIMGREQQFLDAHQKHLELRMEMDRRYTTMQSIPRLSFESLAMVGLGVVVVVMVASSKPLTDIMPTLGLFAATAFRVIPSIGRMLASIQTISYSTPIAATIFRDVGLAEEYVESVKVDRNFHSYLEFRRVNFGYAGSKHSVLKEVSFFINRGEAVGIVGSSGAGKSTLIDIVLGLLTPTSGKVFVDGQDMTVCRRWWQDQIGYVPQDIYLIDDTLRNNIAFGVPEFEIDEVAVQQAVDAAQLNAFVDSLPAGLGTVVGERGVRLSGGQCQRIGIARALYHNPSVLVLDEATSALDSETEAGVIEAVRKLFGEKTVLIIAHRTSTVAHCDRIFRFHDGELVDSGDPSKMLNE